MRGTVRRVDPARRRLVAARPSRPLRPWDPVRRDPGCGVAQYAAELVAALRGIGQAVTHAAEPDPDAAVLHLQHEHSLVAPERVAQVAREARGRGASLVVTEHAVRPQADLDGWEDDVAARSSRTPPRVRRCCRQRRPGRRVELIPHGCPTWFPPRKARRGRRRRDLRLPGAAQGPHHARRRRRRARRRRAAPDRLDPCRLGRRVVRGLDLPVPLRRVAGFLDEDDIARRLAAEADVLVFPYAPPRFAAVSGAVRVGLASGVPVLTSPTTWFSDLRGVTLQTDDLAAGIARLLDDTALRPGCPPPPASTATPTAGRAPPGGTPTCTPRCADRAPRPDLRRGSRPARTAAHGSPAAPAASRAAPPIP